MPNAAISSFCMFRTICKDARSRSLVPPPSPILIVHSMPASQVRGSYSTNSPLTSMVRGRSAWAITSFNRPRKTLRSPNAIVRTMLSARAKPASDISVVAVAVWFCSASGVSPPDASVMPVFSLICVSMNSMTARSLSPTKGSMRYCSASLMFSPDVSANGLRGLPTSCGFSSADAT